jgi:hypothetical protein
MTPNRKKPALAVWTRQEAKLVWKIDPSKVPTPCPGVYRAAASYTLDPRMKVVLAAVRKAKKTRNLVNPWTSIRFSVWRALIENYYDVWFNDPEHGNTSALYSAQFSVMFSKCEGVGPTRVSVGGPPNSDKLWFGQGDDEGNDYPAALFESQEHLATALCLMADIVESPNYNHQPN